MQGGPLTPDHLPQLAYLRQVIEETMRLYPPIPGIPRQAAADDVLCGHPVPRRSIVAILPWVVHRHHRLWTDPDRFDPDNFSPEQRPRAIVSLTCRSPPARGYASAPALR